MGLAPQPDTNPADDQNAIVQFDLSGGFGVKAGLRGGLENQLRGDGDGRPQRAVYGTPIREEAVHTPGGFALRLMGL